MLDLDLKTLAPREWLEYQRRIHGYDASLVPKDLLTGAVKGLPREAGALVDLYSQLTRGQLDDRTIQVYFNPLRPLLKREEDEVIRNVYFGIYPTFEVNGYATTTPRGDRIVMIHSGLPYTVNCWAQFFVYTLKQGSWDFLDNEKEAFLSLLTHIGRIWKKEIKNFPWRPRSLLPKGKDSWLLSAALTHSAMGFVLGHEIGHILEKHQGYNPGDQTYNHRMEFEADNWGLKICLRHVIVNGSTFPDTYYPKFMLCGPFLALSMIATINDFQGKTHPSVTTRFEKVKAAYQPVLLEILGAEGLSRYKREMDEDFLDRILSIGHRLFERHKLFREIVNEIADLWAIRK